MWAESSSHALDKGFGVKGLGGSGHRIQHPAKPSNEEVLSRQDPYLGLSLQEDGNRTRQPVEDKSRSGEIIAVQNNQKSTRRREKITKNTKN